MDVQALIGWNVNRLREDLGISQTELALRCVIVSQGYISKLETGERNPTAVIQFIIATALNVEVGELFSQSNAPAIYIEGPILIKSKRSKIKSLEVQF
ncbi:helix-turn-helix domain-containing protein [Asticcacaulis benevestitus]|uniref:HTH cro/C1-type domain-containing protein n=1 Tax=Asticcacaulis benevestitus DSM 16100 = ATCC BAA-896 TaxID=1121022 RepID=V4P9L6_9CAUL|nr:helix-turn-helix transcriptional regulator [Asticcacaulis benevestitus]ESQ83779.1 hypothetical protein ABENE_20115 [Asticcacaulis benevestitus DSM 16100 = ATCC BAA-896]